MQHSPCPSIHLLVHLLTGCKPDATIAVGSVSTSSHLSAHLHKQRGSMRRSELLEEGEEPFEVLPDARVAPSLLVALHALLAPEDEFRSWRGLEDVLAQLQRASMQGDAAQASCAAGEDKMAAGAVGSAKAEAGEVANCHEQVQPCTNGWHAEEDLSAGQEPAAKKQRVGGAAERRVVHGRAGQEAVSLDRGNCAASGACCRKNTCSSRQAGQALAGDTVCGQEEQPVDGNWRPGVTSIAAMGPRACAVLAACIRQRLACYRLPGLAEDRKQLAAAEVGRASSKKEGARASVAALRLVVAEKELLSAALAAADARAACNAGS